MSQTPQTTVPLGRYFRKFRLQGIRIFRDEVVLNFCLKNGRIAQWTIILGDNGSGKTTLLQYIASLYPEPVKNEIDFNNLKQQGCPPFRPVATSPEWINWHLGNLPEPWDTHPNQKMKALIELSQSACNLNGAAEILKANKDKIQRSLGELTYDLSCRIDEQEKENPLKVTANMSLPSDISLYEQFFLVGYGANRHVAGPTSPYLTSEQYSRQGLNSPVNTLFNNDNPLVSPEQWLLGLDHISKSDDQRAKGAKNVLDRAKECLCHALPDVSNIHIEMSGTPRPMMAVMFEVPYGRVRFNGLSLGYQVMAAWLVDFLRRMYERYGYLPEPEKGPAVVLIDEFDLHLHPKWQMEVMDHLGKIFSNTQFIITAHSPLVIQAAGEEANLAVLRRVKNKDGHEVIIVDNDPIHVRGWRVDQILTSDLYGFRSTRPKKYQRLMNERIELLKKGTLSKEENKKLDELEKRLTEEAPANSSNAREWVRRELKAIKSAEKKKNDSLK